MKEERIPSRSTICWSMFNGTSCLCIECWSCKRKMQYHTKELAAGKALRASKRTKSLIREYFCRYCLNFHIGHSMRRY